MNTQTDLSYHDNRVMQPHGNFCSLRTAMYIPEWLRIISGKREMNIQEHPAAWTTNRDEDGSILPRGQQYIISPIGRMWIDSSKKAIIG